jgi:hypothetical protein
MSIIAQPELHKLYASLSPAQLFHSSSLQHYQGLALIPVFYFICRS